MQGRENIKHFQCWEKMTGVPNLNAQLQLLGDPIFAILPCQFLLYAYLQTKQRNSYLSLVTTMPQLS